MFAIFATIRMLFAADRAIEAIDAAIRNGIESVIIPSLESSKKRSRHLEEYDNLIENYQKLAKVSRSYAIEKNIRGALQYSHIDSEMAIIDIAQDIAGSFFTESTTSAVFGKFNALDGPVRFVSYILKVIFNKARDRARTYNNNIQPSGVDLRNYDWDIQEPDRVDIEETLADMKEYFYANVKKYGVRPYAVDSAIDIFDIFIKMNETRNDFSRLGDTIYEWRRIRVKKQKPANHGYFQDGRKLVKTILEKFFQERKRSVRVGGKTVAERVAKSEFRYRLAKWMLGK